MALLWQRAVSLLLVIGVLGCRGRASTLEPRAAPPTSTSAASTLKGSESADARSSSETANSLETELREQVMKTGGKMGVSVVHVESGRRVSVGGQEWLPLQSVFKLPLAVAVLKEVQAGQLSLDQVLIVRAEDRAPGVAMNQEKWTRVPRPVSLRQLLEYSLVDSDNTSSDKLLELIGGPTVLTERMHTLGFEGIAVRAPTKAMGPAGELPNQGTPDALTDLLVSLERGDLLAPSQRTLLWELLQRARTGEHRIRAGVPAGTPVLDKTGTGANGTVTNDVGVVTLPGDRGHLAIAVMLAGSSLQPRAQEDVIAEVARTAFMVFIDPQ